MAVRTRPKRGSAHGYEVTSRSSTDRAVRRRMRRCPRRARGVASTCSTASATPWTKLWRSKESWRMVGPRRATRRGSPGARRVRAVARSGSRRRRRRPRRAPSTSVERVVGSSSGAESRDARARRDRPRGRDRGARGRVRLAVVVQFDDLDPFEVRRGHRGEAFGEDGADREVRRDDDPDDAGRRGQSLVVLVPEPRRADHERDAVVARTSAPMSAPPRARRSRRRRRRPRRPAPRARTRSARRRGREARGRPRAPHREVPRAPEPSRRASGPCDPRRRRRPVTSRVHLNPCVRAAWREPRGAPDAREQHPTRRPTRRCSPRCTGRGSGSGSSSALGAHRPTGLGRRGAP